MTKQGRYAQNPTCEMHVAVACVPIFVLRSNRVGRTFFTCDKGIIAGLFLLRKELPADSCRCWDGSASGYAAGCDGAGVLLSHDASDMRRRERDRTISSVST
eukprot:6173385-Pleurochrysis_carterae.AAC.3